MTPERIAELRAVIAAATKGAFWEADSKNVVGYISDDDAHQDFGMLIPVADAYSPEVARAIVAACNVLPHALDTIEAQAARIAELEAALKPFADVADTDIGNDEVDEDIFRPMSSQKVASSPLLTVGNLRTASTALQLKEPS